jgi:tRNA wybutosine-synthesizing protein 2
VVPLEDPRERPPRAPLDRVRRALEDDLPAPALEALPEGWRRLGDVVLLDLPDALAGRARTVAAAYGQALDAQAVVGDGPGIAGPQRRPEGRRLLWGDGTETVHREDGLAYHLDPTEVMFSPGNESERRRMGQVEAQGEVVADLFAGIGYFTVPLAARAGARDVVAVDWNPDAVRYLDRNAAANGVADRVHPVRADSRRLGGEGWAHRAVLGLLPDPSGALPAVTEVLREGGVLHYHRTVDRAEAPTPAVDEVREAADAAGAEASLVGTRTVKSTGPGSVHVVVDARVG